MAQDPECRMRDHEAQRVWMIQVLRLLQVQEWYGKLTIVMEGGVIRRIVREEVVLPPVRNGSPVTVRE